MRTWLERGGAERWGRGALHAIGMALLLLPWGVCLGQASGDGDGTMTLHVYENLIQVPVLVLSTTPGPMAPIAADRFTVSLDSGPRFRATHVRREGDDAIALAILLDGPSLGEAATQAAAAVVMALGKGGLRASDSITVYTRACTLKGSSHPQSGTTEGVERALAGGLPGNRLGPTTGCPNQISLWDSLAYVEYALREQAGRRVVVVVSNRNEAGKGRYTERELWRFAGSAAITIFGVMGPDRRDAELALEMLCASSGGAMLTSRPAQYGTALEQLLAMVRGRYIVEFPRASNATAGLHDIRVGIEQGKDLEVRSSGTVVPLPSATVMADPTTIRNDASRLPTMGSRKPVESH